MSDALPRHNFSPSRWLAFLQVAPRRHSMRNRIFAGLMAGVMMTGVVWAQASQAPAEGAKQGMHRRGPGMMMKGLNLTADQKAKVEALHQGERTQMQALRSNNSLTEEQKKQQM